MSKLQEVINELRDSQLIYENGNGSGLVEVSVAIEMLEKLELKLT